MTSNEWWMHLLWIFAAGIVGFRIAAVIRGMEGTIQLPPHY
jgi:hypothetical protein